MIDVLNRFARLASARSEVVGASLIILMVVMMVIPLQPAVLDVLLAVNISISIVLAISAVLIDSPLAFSSFPAILLVTTLFRLSLTISTTRQILLEADAGHIVQTFGEFVVGGNIAVGLTVFIIISVVNFLVVTKGSERVAEVAARFSLDGMPGKQMSIDSDLRAGLITQAVAKHRRSSLEKESQLFGAMDGAIKFVKNDAIAGLVITLVNLLGGLAVGMMQKDMTFSEASHIYTILSVGDGLVAIIPSLLISVAAGLIVTRVTKGESDGSSTASDMFKDLSRNSNALQISAVFCLLFGFIPGMPSFVFFCTSAGLLAAWLFAQKRDDKTAANSTHSVSGDKTLELDHARKFDDITNTEIFAALQLRLPIGLEPTTVNQIHSICRIARNRIVDNLGILVPLFEFTEHKSSLAEVYVFGVPMLTLDLADKRLSIKAEADVIASLEGITPSHEKNRITGRYAYLCDPVHKPVLDRQGIAYSTFETRVLEQVEALIVRKVDQFFTINDYQKHLATLQERFAEQLKELDRVIPTSKVVYVFQRLLAEGVSVKNFSMILNVLIEWGQRERDIVVITEQVRRALSEQICHQHGKDKKIQVYMLSLEFEQMVRESARNDGNISFMDVDASTMTQLIEMVEQQIKNSLHYDVVPAVVCSMDCRPHFRSLIGDAMFCVPVLSHQEISMNHEVKVLGNVVLDEEQSFNN